MFRHFYLSNYKGIKNIYLEHLGQINIICGKNNSGKSSILEGLNTETISSPGFEIGLKELFVQGFKSQAVRYNNPRPDLSLEWFESAIQEYLDENKIVYKRQIPEIINWLTSSQKDNQYLSRYANNIFDYGRVFNVSLHPFNLKFNSSLIPPKRNYSSTTAINLNEELSPNGSGLINKLFYLKNQDFKSSDFKMYRQIVDAFSVITGYRFNIIPSEDNELDLKFGKGEHWVDASDCGLGLRDILLIVSYVMVTNFTAYLIEEPESHLHADYQKKLLAFFKTIGKKQFIISTHSRVFIDSGDIDKIYFCWHDGVEVKVSDQTSSSKILDSLGHSIAENLISDAIVLTEGPTDIPVIKRLFSLFGTDDDFNIKYWPLGGDIMGSLDLSFFSNPKKVFAIIDSDPGSSVIRSRFLKNCKSHGIKCFKLKRYSIENYLSLSYIKEAFPGKIPKKINHLVSDISVDEQVGFKNKGKTIKGKNHIIAARMNESDFQGTDLFESIKVIHDILNS